MRQPKARKSEGEKIYSRQCVYSSYTSPSSLRNFEIIPKLSFGINYADLHQRAGLLRTDGKAIKKLYVSPAIQQQLIKGRLAIVKLADTYELVPAGVADKIAQRDGSYVLSQQAATIVVDEEDPYAKFQIPDDLMW